MVFEPIAGSKKAWAKKAATKEPISYMLLIQVTCGDKKIVEESSMECLQELESTFDYGKELQKQSAVVAVKLREIKASQSTLHLEAEQRWRLELAKVWHGRQRVFFNFNLLVNVHSFLQVFPCTSSSQS